MDTKIIVLATLTLLTACTSLATPVPATVSSTLSPVPTATVSPPSPTESPTPLPTVTSTPTIRPTYAVLRGEVTADQLACRYGPGWPYLYKYGLVKGNNLEIIGRLDDAKWLYVQAIGGNNPCWVKAEFMNIKGDPMSLEPLYPEKVKLPPSPYYSPTTILSATRQGDTVTVFWLDIPLRAGDEEDERMNHYIIEVWRCEAGRIIFEPLATNDLQISFQDERGCEEQSHGRIFVQEKHGFAGPTEITPWPPHPPP
ncbi:MAG: hypothetical protein Fur0043_26170 [Anaerolineales bacterium]